jgi:hypothetical protein
MAEILDQAARCARLDWQQAFIQGTGDGNLTAWPPETSELVMIADFLRELCCELDRVRVIRNSAARSFANPHQIDIKVLIPARRA